MIKDQVDILVQVQGLDSELYKLNELKAAKPAEKQDLQNALDQQKESLKNAENQSKALQLKRKEREMDLETKEKEIKKYQAQLLQIKTNKEYMSMQKQIEGLKADNSVLEDDILGLMDQIDKAKTTVSAEREKMVSAENKVKAESAKIDQEIKQIEEQINSLNKQRVELCVNIDKNLLSRYERILQAKSALALVPVIDQSCGGCHQVLPPQVINETRMKDQLVTCEFCARLLYWAE
ncbi:zinc ribbon domain-containing protein [Candidatus Omnitrophota bacterium]